MNGGWTSRYYTAIFNGKKDHAQWSVKYSMAVCQFLLCERENWFTFPPRIHQVSTGPTEAKQLSCMAQQCKLTNFLLTLHYIERGFSCHSNGG